MLELSELQNKTVDELRHIAAEMQVPGYSTARKHDLCMKIMFRSIVADPAILKQRTSAIQGTDKFTKIQIRAVHTNRSVQTVLSERYLKQPDRRIVRKHARA